MRFDEIRGAEQRGEDFAAKIHKAFESYSPPGVRGSGTWHDRDPNGTTGKIWHYIWDTILKDVQKFYSCLNAVLNMDLSGVTCEQKVNIAVAVCLKKVKEGKSHYHYKDFDANKWQLFKAYVVLKETGKLAEPVPAQRPSEELAAQSDEDDNRISSDANEGFITDSSNLRPTTRGKNKAGFAGRDAAKKAASREEDLKRKTAALRSFAGTEKKKLKVMQDIETQVKTQNIIAVLSHPAVASNRTISKRLAKDVLVQLGVAKNQSPNTSSRQMTGEQMTPGDLLNDKDDADEDESAFDDCSLSSSGSSDMERPLGGEALRNHEAAMARGAARQRAEANAEVASVVDCWLDI